MVGPTLLRLAARLAVGDEPLQRDVNIVLLLARDRIAADLTILKGIINLNLNKNLNEWTKQGQCFAKNSVRSYPFRLKSSNEVKYCKKNQNIKEIL